MRVALVVGCLAVAVPIIVGAGAGGMRREVVVETSHKVGASPAGKIAVIPAGSGVPARLEVARLDGQQRHVLATLPGVISGAVWSTRGDRIAVSFKQGAATSGGTFVLDARGRIVARMRGGVLAGSWSPDGRYLVTDGSSQPECRNGVAVRRSLHLIVYAAGRLVHDLPIGVSPLSGDTAIANSVGSVAWSPKNDRLAYVVSEFDCANARAGSGPSTLFVIEVNGGKRTAVFGKSASKSGWGFLGSPAWAPTGRSIAFAAGCLDGANGAGCQSLIMVGALGSDPRVVRRDEDGVLANSVIWPTARTLVFGRIRAFEGIRSGIGTIDLRNGQQRWLIRARTDNESVCDYGTLKLSADGRDVVSEAWNSWPTPQIIVARIEGSRSSRTPYSVGDNREVADTYVP